MTLYISYDQFCFPPETLPWINNLFVPTKDVSCMLNLGGFFSLNWKNIHTFTFLGHPLLKSCHSFIQNSEPSAAVSQGKEHSCWACEGGRNWRIFPPPQPATQTDTLRQRHHSTLTHAIGTSLHCTPPTNTSTPCTQDFHQSLTPSYATTTTFPRLIVAIVWHSVHEISSDYWKNVH